MPKSNLKVPNGRSVRNKGLAFERELAKYLSSKLGLDVARGAAGAQAFDMTKGSGDLYGLPRLSVEAKRTERFTLRDFQRQNRRNATGNDLPAVIHRYNGQATGDATVVLTLDDFLVFYRAYLEQTGHAKA